MGLRTLIVDDEPVARQVLREELETLDTVEIAGEAEDGISALAAMRELQPDLVFLDLQMPGMGGFDVIRELRPDGPIPVIVIVTAFDRHAIQAFEAGVVDYLLKPIGHDRLVAAVERAARICGVPSALGRHFSDVKGIADAPTERVLSAQGFQPKPARKIVARSGDEYLLLNPEEVFAFQADGDLVWIVTAKQRYLATQSLKAIQQKLENTTFRRIHRKVLVNTQHVRKMSTLSSQRWLITLSNSQEFVVSKKQAGTVRQLLRW